MLRILSKKDFQDIQVHTTLPHLFEEYEELMDTNKIFKEGLWLEYWDNQVINFKFHVISGIVTIYSGNFSSNFTQEELDIFFRGVVHIDDLFEWVENNVTLEVKEKLPKASDKITEIRKYDTEIYFGYGNDIMKPEDPLFSNYYEFLIQNTKTIRSLPYNWGTGLKFRCLNPKDIDDKLYWINLCALKLYVTRKYSRSNKKCK